MTESDYSKIAPYCVPSFVKYDLTGQCFSRLTVLGFACRDFSNGKRNGYKWLCACSCGNYTAVSSGNLKGGSTKSCGCFSDESRIINNTTHGRTRTTEYKSWQSAKDRCYNPKNKKHPFYGARGITVCDQWRNSFETFLEDMGERPEPKHSYSLERKNVNGNYEPDNCIWADSITQMNNTTRNHWIGDETLSQLCRRLDLPYKGIFKRLSDGWCHDCAFSLPIRAGIKGCPHR